MRLTPGIRLFLLAAAAAVPASPALGAEPAPLPLSRIRLYETGVGYFERTGTISGRGVGLPVPAGHLDDALKTLVVLSDDPETRIGGVEFASSLSPGRARSLAGLPGPEDPSPLGLSALLRSLRGANVEVTTKGARATGRLVDVLGAETSDLESCVQETAPAPGRSAPCTPKKHATLILLGATGDIRRVRIDDVQSVRPTEPEFARRIAAAVDSASDRNARVQKELDLHARGKKSVTLGYVTETPVWRASYRLVLGDAKQAKLQGWALLHNDTDEPWRGVRVEIVNGRPDSFLFPLAAPRYSRRELVTPTEPLYTLPQLGSATADQLWGDEIGESYGVGGLGLSGNGEGGGGRGEGIGLGSVGTLGHGAGTGAGDASDLLAIGNLAGISAATGVEAGALFRFTLAEPVDLRAHGSVLAPFLVEAIESVRIALFAVPGGIARSAVRLTHRGTQTLPSGTMAVFADGGFAGESILARMKPSETQVLEFGSDLDVELSEKEHRTTDETRLLSFEGDELVEHFVRRHAVRYEIKNRSGADRVASLVLEFVNNAKVEGAESLAHDARSGRVLAAFSVPKQSVQTRALSASEGLVHRHGPKALTTATLRRIDSRANLPAQQKKLVKDALLLSLERDAAVKNRSGWRFVLADRQVEVGRLRAHASAVGPAATEDIAERLLGLEDEMKLVRRHVAVFAAKVADREWRIVATLTRLSSKTR
jgi:hypothetical protein